MVSFTQKGDFSKTMSFMERALRVVRHSNLDKYAQEGLEALRAATPVDSGRTADSWYYEIIQNGDTVRITWYNSNVNDGVPIAIVLQYGHATKDGGYIRGLDYINPAIRPVFDRIADDIWREVTKK